MSEGFARYQALLALLANRGLTGTLQCTVVGTSHWKHYCIQGPENQTRDRIRYNTSTQLWTTTVAKGGKLQAAASNSQQRGESVSGLSPWNTDHLELSSRHASPAGGELCTSRGDLSCLGQVSLLAQERTCIIQLLSPRSTTPEAG